MGDWRGDLETGKERRIERFCGWFWSVERLTCNTNGKILVGKMGKMGKWENGRKLEICVNEPGSDHPGTV